MREGVMCDNESAVRLHAFVFLGYNNRHNAIRLQQLEPEYSISLYASFAGA